MKESFDEKLVPNIKEALSELFSKTGRWVSVRDFPIGSLFKEHGLSTKHSTAAVEVLGDLGCVQFEGERSGMKFKIGDVRHDLQYIAQQIQIVAERKICEYKSSNNPIRRKKKSLVDYDNNSEVQRVLRKVEIPKLGDLRYCLWNNQIIQVKIVGLKLLNYIENSNISFTVFYYNEEGDKDEISGLTLSKLFEDVDSLLQHLKKDVKLFN